VASYVEFVGYTRPWYSVRDGDAPVGDGMGSITCFLRDGGRGRGCAGRPDRRDPIVARPCSCWRPHRGTVLFSIGEFSDVSGLPPQTLRFHHSEGLLVPESVDEKTGYRSYAYPRSSRPCSS
jgi:hypothetical protein